MERGPQEDIAIPRTVPTHSERNYEAIMKSTGLSADRGKRLPYPTWPSDHQRGGFSEWDRYNILPPHKKIP